MLGWLADLFRLAWGLLYWNTRKAWFRQRRGRARCPCQTPSDSGRPFETGCDACVQWHRPSRFRRVCPLLVETKDGLRCSANTADVRPFWGRALGYYGGTALSIYLAGAIVVFAFLRTIGYPISIVHVTWPGLWYRVPQARGWFFSQKSQRAFAEGRTAEGLLYLANAYDFDPANYALGLTLAKSYQSGQPHASDLVFERLLREHPAQRNFTLQEWFRALLARGDFEKITTIARAEVLADPAQANVWMRALLFATRQTGDEAALRELLANPSPGAVQWHQLLETELLIRAGLAPEARAALDRDWPVRAPAFTLFYRVSALTALGDTYAAVDVLERNALPMGLDGDTHDTLLLDAYAAAGADRPLQHELDRLLTARLTLQKITVLCTHLIRHPSAETFGRLCDKVRVDGIRFDNDSSGVWFSLVCTAGAVGETTRLHALVLSLKQAVKSRFRTLDAVESFFRGESAAMRITTFLPVLPLPLEIDYALIDRYPGPVRPPPADADKST